MAIYKRAHVFDAVVSAFSNSRIQLSAQCPCFGLTYRKPNGILGCEECAGRKLGFNPLGSVWGEFNFQE
jgi:hypothetical protein